MSLVFQRMLVGYNFNERWTSEHNRNHLKTWEEYKGLCLEKISKGDDLYMIVWDNENNCPKEVRYGSHSVKSFSKVSSYVDATQDIILKYDAYKEQRSKELLLKSRAKLAKKLIELRCIERSVLIKFDITQKRLRSLLNLIGYDKYMLCLLLLIKRFRNEFKRSMQSKLVNHLTSDKINYPFSFREWELVRSILN